MGATSDLTVKREVVCCKGAVREELFEEEGKDSIGKAHIHFLTWLVNSPHVSHLILTQLPYSLCSSAGITVLLSLTVFMLLVAEIMPATSDSVPLIGKCKQIYIQCKKKVSFPHESANQYFQDESPIERRKIRYRRCY